MENGTKASANKSQKVYDSNKIYKAGGIVSSLEITTGIGTFAYVNGMPIQVEITEAGVIDDEYRISPAYCISKALLPHLIDSKTYSTYLKFI